MEQVPGDALAILRSEKEPLFGILDAARSRRILELLRDSSEEFQSLYEGKSAEDLVDFAPYVVELPVGSELLEDLIREGWGDSWGVYLKCGLPLDEVRRHFRKFLMIEVGERKAYFRFYDPRVLRIFLPTCSLSDRHEFFGPVEAFWSEASDQTGVLRFSNPGVRHESRPRIPA